MTNLWKSQGIPHKGWSLVAVVDVREDGQSEDETEYETCMMCGHEKIRYVHIVEHKELEDIFRVGCHCAENMTGDYVNPEKHEKELRNKANRRKSWITKKWGLSKKGNLYLKVDSVPVVICRESDNNSFRVIIGKTVGKKLFSKLSDAKMAAFNGVEYLKKRGELK